MQLYDATKLLSQTDINGNKPQLFISTTNRSSGKTTWFSRYLIKRFKKYGEKFSWQAIVEAFILNVLMLVVCTAFGIVLGSFYIGNFITN